MKHCYLKSLLVVIALNLCTLTHAQSAPMMVHYQGRLTQPNGLPLTSPTASVAFEIFPSASGGTRLWPPAGPLSTYTVILRNGGIFSVMLGDTSIPGMAALTQSVFQQGVVYLQISIAGNPVGPRQPIVSVPWSILSQQANTVVDGAISTPKLANDAVTSAKLAAEVASLTKISNGFLLAGSSGVGINRGPSPNAMVSIRGVLSDGYSTGISLADYVGTERYLIDILNGGLSLRKPGDVSPRLLVNSDGNVGIGTVNPQAKLVIGGTGGKTLEFDHSSGANWTVTTQADQDISLYARHFNLIGPYSGLLTMTNSTALKPGGGPWADLNSDRRLKTDISPLDNSLQMLLSLRGVKYRFKDPKSLNERPGMRRGFIAQEVEEAFPEWVVTKPNGYKTISFDSGFDALTVEAFREQQNQIETLRNENERLRRQNAGFEARLRALEAKSAR